jgi:hypothetical protein
MITRQSFGAEIGQETLPVINLTWVKTKVRLYKLMKLKIGLIDILY